MIKILYNDKPEIGIEELNSIYLALLSSADAIYINNDIKVSAHLNKKVYSHIVSNISFLEDNGLIKRWAWPHLVPSLAAPSLVKFPEKEYVFWSKLIDETFLQGNNLESILEIADRHYGKIITREERSSKIVSIKREYMTFATCSSLNLDQILNNYGQYQPSLITVESTKYANIDKYCTKKEPLVRKIFSKYGIPSLWPLTGKDVKGFNRKNMSFRSAIDVKSSQIGKEGYTLDNAFADIAAELFALLDERIAENFASIFASFLWNILGLHYTPASFVLNLNDTITELLSRNKFGFVYFMSKVKRVANKRANNII